MENQVEIWKAHPDIDGIEVSSFGRVRSVKGHYCSTSPRSDGYMQVCFSISGKQVNKKVHRLVAQTFIPNPNNMPQVNHKDCNRANNNVNNLEWCTGSYNCQYRDKFGKALGHHVLAVNLTTLEVSRYPSQSEASRKLEIRVGNINDVIKGRYKQACGYWFTNADESVAYAIKKKLYDISKAGLKANIVSADFVRQVLSE